MDFPWVDVVEEVIRRWSTPCYVAAWAPVQSAYDELAELQRLDVPVRHWYSIKTQPLKPLLVACRERLGYGAEVVSLFELLAARDSGFVADAIIVNGLAKHAWLPSGMPGLRVHLDSERELECLGPDRLRTCRLGVRVHVPTEHDPGDPSLGAQFGVEATDLAAINARVEDAGLVIDGIHFHLRSNIRDPGTYARAADLSLSAAAAAGVKPQYLDCGGGLPVPGETTLEHGTPVSGALPLAELVDRLSPVVRAHPSVREVWFENGRFLTSRGAVLVVRVRDIKQRGGCRFLLCDGGRTNNALPADWQPNPITTLPARTAPAVDTVLIGPTCTAYDRLARRELPSDIAVGDYIVWHNAGAYHLSWETRFSQGLAKIIWCDDRLSLSVARPREDFGAWWSA